MHLLQLIASFSTWPLTLALALTPEPTTINYGHWRLTLYENWSFTGSYSKKSVRSEYWTPAGTLGGIVYCADEYSLADGRGDISTPCNDTSFSCSLLDYKTNLYEIKQTVDLGGEMVALVGRENMTMRRSEVGNTLQSDGLIDAILDT